MKSLPIFLLFSALVFAQDTPPTGGKPSGTPPRIVTRTRTVALFSDLENKLITSFEKKDGATLREMTADDFEERHAISPSIPIPRDEWLEGPVGGVSHPLINDMAVHMFGEGTAVVSLHYYYEKQMVSGPLPPTDFFIVDVWTRTLTGWKLAVRYTSPMPDSSPSKIRRPNGKE